MVSQFVSSHKVRLLGDLDFDFPEGTHAIGRLDNHSEGLLILTTNKKVTQLLFQGKVPHGRTYLVLVKYEVHEATLQQLRNGVSIQVAGGGYYTTSPCEVEIEPNPEKYVTTVAQNSMHHSHTWLRITLTEGKFHQVRKMVKAVRHPCRRLIRISIENLFLDGLESGCVREIAEKDFFEKLKINNWE
ncbi:pseudouridine synthase [Phnomibacter sp. MR]|uniref:pseudouridine synthase n=1 Tax=Phnomibacter sp. MR TaxID=3042318 RepID=UPI003A803647